MSQVLIPVHNEVKADQMIEGYMVYCRQLMVTLLDQLLAYCEVLLIYLTILRLFIFLSSISKLAVIDHDSILHFCPILEIFLFLQVKSIML